MTPHAYRYLDVPPEGTARPRGTLLLIHAFPLNAQMWEAQRPLAASGWRIVAPHLRGFAGGVAGQGVVSMDDYAADVVGLIDELHIEDAVIGGLSMGGYVAFALLRRAPDRFKGLLLADTRAEADTPDVREGRMKMLALVREHGSAGVADQMMPRLLAPQTVANRVELVQQVREMITSNDVQAIERAITAMMTRRDANDLLPRLRCPALVLAGECDLVTPPVLAEQIARAIPEGRMAVIPSAGHLANLEAPRAFNAAVVEFLERII